jgi:hypothetical protein
MEDSASVAVCVAIGSVLVGCGAVEVGEGNVGVGFGPQAADTIAMETIRQSNRRSGRSEFLKKYLVGRVLDQGVLSRGLHWFLRRWFICISGGRSAL